jgi:hypothetical protein
MPIQTTTILEGEKAYLPIGSSIISKTTSGGIDIASSCIDTTPSPRNCWRFVWERAEGDPSWDNAVFNKIIIQGITYTFNSTSPHNGSAGNVLDEILACTPLGLVTDGIPTGSISDTEKVIVFRLPSTVTSLPELIFINPTTNYTATYKVVAEQITCPSI